MFVVTGLLAASASVGVFNAAGSGSRLSRLRPGDHIDIDGSTGSVRFQVERVEEYPKTAFPTRQVYGPTPTPILRLITCGGTFDPSTRHYRDTVLVYALLTINPDPS